MNCSMTYCGYCEAVALELLAERDSVQENGLKYELKHHAKLRHASVFGKLHLCA